MRVSLNIILLIYAIIMTLIAYPMIYTIMYEDEDNAAVHTPLEGAAVDSQWEFTRDVASLIEYAYSLGYKLTFGEAWRHVHMQKYYVAHGLSWTMNSNHRKRRAVDFNLFIDDKYVVDKEPYAILGDYWESLDKKNRWGGRFNDAPHFERR